MWSLRFGGFWLECFMKEGGEVWSTLVAKFGNVNKGEKIFVCYLYYLELVWPTLRGSQRIKEVWTKLDTWAFWSNSPKTKLDASLLDWMGGKLSPPPRRCCADGAGWTWGWCINPDPWANLDILFPDGPSPAVDSGIPARPIHHRSTRFLTLGEGEAPRVEHLPLCFYPCG